MIVDENVIVIVDENVIVAVHVGNDAVIVIPTLDDPDPVEVNRPDHTRIVIPPNVDDGRWRRASVV